MSVIVLLLFVSLLLGTAFLFLFVHAVRSGQYHDTTTPAMRVIADDEPRTVKQETGDLTQNGERRLHEQQ